MSPKSRADLGGKKAVDGRPRPSRTAIGRFLFERTAMASLLPELFLLTRMRRADGRDVGLYGPIPDHPGLAVIARPKCQVLNNRMPRA